MPYGFRGSALYEPPEPAEALRLLQTAFDSGITLVDTAPTYGIAEDMIGQAFPNAASRPVIATKVIIPDDGNLAAVTASVEKSLERLRTDTIDLLQVHNLTILTLERGEIFECLEKLRSQGKVQHIGGSIEDEDAAWLALSNDSIESIQAPFNLLNQKIRRRVLPGAAKRSCGILIRSAYLRGVLTEALESIPARLAPLKAAAQAAWNAIDGEAATLAEAALRFCLSFPEVSSIVVGMRSIAEMESNLAAAAKGPLSQPVLQKLARFAVEDETLITPRYWQDLI